MIYGTRQEYKDIDYTCSYEDSGIGLSSSSFLFALSSEELSSPLLLPPAIVVWCVVVNGICGVIYYGISQSAPNQPTSFVAVSAW